MMEDKYKNVIITRHSYLFLLLYSVTLRFTLLKISPCVCVCVRGTVKLNRMKILGVRMNH